MLEKLQSALANVTIMAEWMLGSHSNIPVVHFRITNYNFVYRLHF